jgi:dTDP-4-amino-4,6-dideoxygalactose transaminase
MNIQHAGLTSRFNPQSPDDALQIANALATGLSGTSDTVGLYEEALAAWFEAPCAVAVSSGSSAVIVALATLNLQPGDEVLLTPTCPLCTVYPIMALRLKPVFCDVEPMTFSLDLEKARSRLSPRTKAVIDIPMWGYPIQADRTAQFAKDHGLHFVLDLAHAHGVKLHGRHLWSYAEIATFSTHSSKIFSTGEGGFLLAADEETAAAARAYSRFGNLDGVHFGLNYKLGGLQAALGMSRLKRLAVDIRHRTEIARRYDAVSANPNIGVFPVCEGGTPSYLSYLVLPRRGTGADLREHLAARGIGSEMVKYDAKPLYRHPALSAFAHPCPEATRLLESVTTLPTHPGMSERETQFVIQSVLDYAA